MSDILEQEISEKIKQEQEELPVLTAQRFLNIFRQIHIFSDRKRKQFDQELLALPTEVIMALQSLPGASLLTAHIDELKGISPANNAHLASSVQQKTKEKVSEPEKTSGQEKNAAPETEEKIRIPFYQPPQTTIIDNSFAETLSQSLTSALHQMEKAHSSEMKQLMDAILVSKKGETSEDKTQQFSEALSMVMDSQAKMFSDMIEAQTKTISDILSTQNAQRAAEAAALSYVISTKNESKTERSKVSKVEETKTDNEDEKPASVPLKKRLSRLFSDKGQENKEQPSSSEEQDSVKIEKDDFHADTSDIETSVDVEENIIPEEKANETSPSDVIEETEPKSFEEEIHSTDTYDLPDVIDSIDAVENAAPLQEESAVDFADSAIIDKEEDESTELEASDNLSPSEFMETNIPSDELTEETPDNKSSESKKKKKKKKNKNKKSFEADDTSSTDNEPEFDDDIAKDNKGQTADNIEDILSDIPEQTIYDFGNYEETPANDFAITESPDTAEDEELSENQNIETININDFKPLPSQEEAAEISEEQNQDKEALQNIKTSLADFASDDPVSLDNWSWDNLDDFHDDSVEQQVLAEEKAEETNPPVYEEPVYEEPVKDQQKDEAPSQDYEWEYEEAPADEAASSDDDSEWEWEYEEVPEGEDDSEWEWEYEEVPEDEDDNKNK